MSDAPTGPTVGEVCCSLTGDAKITSTVSFHLKELRQAGIITMTRQGKNMICRLNPDPVRQLADYFGGGATAIAFDLDRKESSDE